MRKLLALAAAAVLPLAAGCAVHQDTAPSPSGPAETGFSLKLAASTDLVPQDGLHPANVSVTAFDAGGHPIAAQVHFSMNPAGFGTLSTDGNGNVVTTTDASRPAVVAYLPPATTTGASTTVTIFASLLTSDLTTVQQQRIQVLTQPAVSLPVTSPSATMTLSPSSNVYATNTTITFDGSTSCAVGPVGACSGGAITKYTWNFGDNTASVTGSSVSHAYTSAGTYQASLTIVTDTKAMASTTQTIVVQAIASPTADFTISPSSPTLGTTVNFNAATSTAAAGHTLVNYNWNFGDGSTANGSSVTQSHAYAAKGVFTVTLTVTDDAGQTKTTTKTVTVS